jgi:hypothetical protein
LADAGAVVGFGADDQVYEGVMAVEFGLSVP